MEPQFKTIGILAKTNHPNINNVLTILLNFLQQQQLKIVITEKIAECIQTNSTHVASLEEIGSICDLIISVGGDGTFLAAAHASVQAQIPLVGINLGQVGFLVDIYPQELCEKLQEILFGKYNLETRFLLQVQIVRNQQIIKQEHALNEVVIHRWITPSMIEISTYINGQLLNTQRSDGLIIATPTGSTAYSLSAGGPILHPTLNAMVLVPLNPHTFSNRPIVIDSSAQIEIRFGQTRQINALISCDHLEIPQVLMSDHILIKKYDTPIKILHPQGHDFFYTLRKKLNWSVNNNLP